MSQLAHRPDPNPLASRYLTSSTLLDRLKMHRDQEAWERFQKLYSVLMRRWGKDFGLQAGDAADAAQEISLHVFTHIGHFQHRHPGAFRAWLRMIARNKIRHIRRQKRVESLESIGIRDLADDQSGKGLPERQWNRLRARAMEQIRPEFEDTTWQAFHAVYEEDDCPKMVAARLGMSVNAVYIARSRVLGSLRRRMERLMEDEVCA